MRRALLVLVLLTAGCTAEPAATATPAPAPTPTSEAPCRMTVATDALPTWARAGFTGDGSGSPHVVSRDGDMLGVVFGAPLQAPPAPDRGNKILWVSKAALTPGDDLLITAKRDGSTETAERKVMGGPVPSIIDLPTAGCWRLTLRWSGHTDTMDLTYAS
jgi:hypothetical protein